MGIAPRRPVMPRPCQTCGRRFKPRDNRKAGRFCSKPCQNEGQRTLKPRPCEWCRKTFQPTKDGARRFCTRTCASRATAAKRPGRYVTTKGYVALWRPGHPMASKTGYVMEHRLVMAEHLGRMLTADEVVHHKPLAA